jgi:hypothetical protein
MTHSEKAYESAPPNVLLLLAMTAGMWGLVYLGVVSVWSRTTNHSGSPDRERVPQLATLTDQQPQVKSPARTRMMAKRSKRVRPSFAERVFRSSTSIN